MADAYARKDDTKNEFAIYDAVLQELAVKSQNVPLGTAEGAYDSANNYPPRSSYTSGRNESDAEGEEGGEDQRETSEGATLLGTRLASLFNSARQLRPRGRLEQRSPEYARRSGALSCAPGANKTNSASARSVEPRDRP